MTTAAITRRCAEASNVFLALSLLSALISFRASLLFFFTAGLLRAVATLPTLFPKAATPADSGPLPALQ